MIEAGLVVGVTLWLLTMPGRRRRREREAAALRAPEDIVAEAIERARRASSRCR